MKDTHVLAAACGLALIAIVGVFISSPEGDGTTPPREAVLSDVAVTTRIPARQLRG